MINSPVVAVNDFLHHIFVFIALGGIAGIILSFLSVRFLTRGLVRPLRSMQETTGAIMEVEIELKEGEAEAITGFMEEYLQEYQLPVEMESKFRRGVDLFLK